MSRTAKDLDSLIRLRRWTVDERRRVLAALQDREAELLVLGQRLAQNLIREQKLARADPLGAGLTYAAYAEDVRRRQRELAGALVQLRKEIEAARDDLAAAYSELKVTEEVRKARAHRELLEENRREQTELDEIGAIAHGRRRAGLA